MTAAAAAAALTVTLSPAVAHPSAQVHVHVTGLNAPSAVVMLSGGVTASGRWLGWVPLARGGRGWSAVLETPAMYGVYPVHVSAGGRVRSAGATLEVVPPGFTDQPGFDSSKQVAQWWTYLVPRGAVLQRVTTWSSGLYAHRDPSLNRLLQIRVRLLGGWAEQHLRRGVQTVYLNIARANVAAPWRLLGLVSAP